jgi:hypothetical protein
MTGIVGRVVDRRRISEANREQNRGAKSDGENTGLEGFIDRDGGCGRVNSIGMHFSSFLLAISPDSSGFKFLRGRYSGFSE